MWEPRLESTYKELKPSAEEGGIAVEVDSLESTYKELKRKYISGELFLYPGLESTYKELKHSFPSTSHQ